jgi:xylulokinase
MTMAILALDVGSSSIKAAVLDTATAEPIGSIARTVYELDTPCPDAAEVPTDRLWSAIRAAAHEALASGVPVEGVGLSCLMPALVLLDAADRPLTPILTHLDRRARPIARRVWQDVGPEFLATVGNRPLPGGISVLCYRHLVENDPRLRERVRSYIHANGWLGLHLTGVKAFDRANACFTGLYGTLTDRQWSSRWCDYFEVDRNWLPPVISGDETLGTLRPEAARELGLQAGLPVKLGTADTSSAMLAANMRPGDLLHVVGTTQVLAALTDRPVPAANRLTRLLGVGDSFIHVTHNPVGGGALSWLRELCFRDQDDHEFYGRLIALAGSRQTEAVLDPPFLGGDRLEIEAGRAAFRELTLATDRLDLLAALLTAMRRGHESALQALGLKSPIQRVFLTGGGADVVRTLIPAYKSTPVQMLEEGSLRGVARLFMNSTCQNP